MGAGCFRSPISNNCPRPTFTSISTDRCASRRCSTSPTTQGVTLAGRYARGPGRRPFTAARTPALWSSTSRPSTSRYRSFRLKSALFQRGLRARRRRRRGERSLHRGALLADASHAVWDCGSPEWSRPYSPGLWEAQKDYGVVANVILCGIRNISPESSVEMAQLAVAYKNRGVVGFDLAGAEYDYPAKHHVKAFKLVHNNNIAVTIHAGEAYGPASVHQAIHVCGAHRIGHGCRLREDGDLLHYVNDHRIALECCPSSNIQTGAVSDLRTHPLKLYHDLGLRVTVNTDNRSDRQHDRVARALALPHSDGARPPGHLPDHHQRLQGRVSAISPEADDGSCGVAGALQRSTGFRAA